MNHFRDVFLISEKPERKLNNRKFKERRLVLEISESAARNLGRAFGINKVELVTELGVIIWFETEFRYLS